MRDWLLRITLVGAAVGLSALASGLMVDVQTAKAQEFNYCDFIEEETDGQEYCGLSVEKERTSDSTTEVGGHVVFEITVTNTGTVALTNIGVDDEFDEELEFDDSSIDPTFGPDSGLVVWDPVDTDDDGPDTLFEGDSLTITVEFDALAEAESADNCAQAFADVLLKKSSEGLSEQGDGASPDISTEFDCDDVTIAEDSDGGGNGGPDAFVTPTDVPELPAPTSVPSTVPTAVPTQPSGEIAPEITAPDTGSGPDGSGGSSAALLLGVLAAGMTVAGAGIVAATRRRAPRPPSKELFGMGGRCGDRPLALPGVRVLWLST